MNLTRNTNRFLARLLVGLMVFAQGAVSHAYAAPLGEAAAVVAPAQDVMSAMSCHEEQAPSLSGCLTHCSQADQAYADHQVFPAAPVSTAYWQVAAHSGQHVSPAVIRRQAPLDTGPPLTIRFCSFLN